MDNQKLSKNLNLPCKTRQEIAKDLSISVRTLQRRLTEFGIYLPRKVLLLPTEYLPIYRAFIGDDFDENSLQSLDIVE